MSLVFKKLSNSERSMYIYYPDYPMHNPYKLSSLTVLREDDKKESVEALLETGLAKLAEEYKLVLCFPNPAQGGWNYTFDSDKEDDLTAISQMQDSMNKEVDTPMTFNHLGIPTLESMLSAWHLMFDTRYLCGIGEGASMAYTFAACKPDAVAGLFGIGGSLSEMALKQAVKVPMHAVLVGAESKVQEYFVEANEAKEIEEARAYIGEEGNAAVDNATQWISYANSANPLQSVTVSEQSLEVTEELLQYMWQQHFAKVRRMNTGAHGDVTARTDLQKGFEWFIEDCAVDGTPHTWLVHTPESVAANPEKKVPLMIFMHGGSDNPEEAAEMSKFHEIGEKEGFITVYPWGTNRAGWNSNMFPDEEDDTTYVCKLIDYLVEHNPIDAGRVYLSGFSNGAGMAQVVAMVCPGKIAAICPIDANWPGTRVGASKVDYRDVIPMAIALQKNYDYRMPVWYTYGTREPSYPVYEGCSQQHQYDFWKLFNNIEVKFTPPQDNPHPCGCGVEGDVVEHPYPSEIYPHHHYSIQRFMSEDEGAENLYNYVIMHDKGHEVAPMDPVLGWEYVKQFRRNADGSVERVEEN